MNGRFPEKGEFFGSHMFLNDIYCFFVYWKGIISSKTIDHPNLNFEVAILRRLDITVKY